MFDAIGSRALGLNEAVTAIVDDATSVYANPAGFSCVKK